MSDIKKDFFDEKYNKMTDENLLQEITQNQNNIALDCLINRYKDVVGMKANKFFMVGSEKDDMLQEGYIGLYKAVKSFDKEKQNSFKTFAGLCIERQMITAVKNSNRQKHIPLNSSLSLNSGAYDEEYFTVVENAIDDSLSDFEKKVLQHYKNGESYAEIAQKLQSKVKSVDTAIQRIRKKAMKIKQKIEEGD